MMGKDGRIGPETETHMTTGYQLQMGHGLWKKGIGVEVLHDWRITQAWKESVDLSTEAPTSCQTRIDNIYVVEYSRLPSLFLNQIPCPTSLHH